MLMGNIQASAATSYRIVEPVLHVIFPWTVTFSNSNSTSGFVKVVLSKPIITHGVEINNWKEKNYPPLNNINCNK